MSRRTKRPYVSRNHRVISNGTRFFRKNVRPSCTLYTDSARVTHVSWPSKCRLDLSRPLVLRRTGKEANARQQSGRFEITLMGVLTVHARRANNVHSFYPQRVLIVGSRTHAFRCVGRGPPAIDARS